MVGVPGRSKGCNTCRRRRVKCDEEKPNCVRCINGGFHCLGYERHRTWHHTSSAPFEEESAEENDRRSSALVAGVSRTTIGTSPPRELSFVAFQNDFSFAALQDRTAYTEGSKAILQNAEGLLTNVFVWRWQWDLEFGRYVSYDPLRSYTSIPTVPFLSLNFIRPTTAHDSMLYNTVLMWLFGLLYKLDPGSAPLRIMSSATASKFQSCLTVPDDGCATAKSTLALPGEIISVRDAAIETCQAYSWISANHSRGCDSARYYLFPMGTALSVLREEKYAFAWARAMLDSSPVTKHYGSGKSGSANPSGFGFYVTSEALHPSGGFSTQRIFTREDCLVFDRLLI